jgi:glycosyltransferase involved in cell wall biosynthesis
LPLSGATILQVIPHLSAGGAERTTIEVAEALAAAGAKALVLSTGGRLEVELFHVGGELIRFEHAAAKNPLQIVSNANAIAKIIKERKVDLVHARSRAPAWSAMWAARRMKKPFVTTYHGVYNASSIFKRWYNSVMARGDVVIANSEYTAAHVREEYGTKAGPIVTIPRGVDIEDFSQDSVSPERKGALAEVWRLPRQGSSVLILLPARMTGWKGHREAIEAAKLLKGRRGGPPWRMIFAGDAQGRTGYLGELKQLISGHGLDDRITIVGHCSDMPAALALADIVIAPSNEPEAFGRVVAEAGAMGVPAIGTDIGAQGEIIVDGETGLIVPAFNPARLAEAVGELIDLGPSGRQAMGRAAERRVRERFTTAALQQATLAVYDKLIGRPA